MSQFLAIGKFEVIVLHNTILLASKLSKHEVIDWNLLQSLIVYAPLRGSFTITIVPLKYFLEAISFKTGGITNLDKILIPLHKVLHTRLCSVYISSKLATILGDLYCNS